MVPALRSSETTRREDPGPTVAQQCPGKVQTWAPGHLGGEQGPRSLEKGEKHRE